MTTMNTTTKDRVLQRLEAHKGSFVSGGKLASDLGVTRNSIWKAIRALQAEGYDIESVTGRGYRLSAASTILSAASIQHYVTDHRIVVEYHDSIDSTNTRCKLLAEHGAPEGTFVVANCQTAGRGRQGRPFYSPKGAGIYFSLLLRPTFELEDVSLLTTYAACVTARAIEEIFGLQTQIKWVNDIFCNGHKVCGILTEAQFSAESHAVTYVVVGIGVNARDPKAAIPSKSRTSRRRSPPATRAPRTSVPSWPPVSRTCSCKTTIGCRTSRFWSTTALIRCWTGRPSPSMREQIRSRPPSSA